MRRSAIAHRADQMVLMAEAQIAFKVYHGLAFRVVFFIEFVFLEIVRIFDVQIMGAENVEDLVRQEFSAGFVAGGLDHRAKLRMHGLGKFIAKALLHDERSPALPGLAVDADDRLVFASDVRRVDRQIWNLPILGIVLAHVVDSLFDGILMRTGEGCKHQVARIGMAVMHLHAGAFFINFTDLTDVGEIQLRVHALGIHIHRDIHDVRIARAFAVSKEGPFHTLRACQEAQLGGGRRRTAVVVRMQADDDAVAVFDMAAEIFDLIRVMVRGCSSPPCWGGSGSVCSPAWAARRP